MECKCQYKLSYCLWPGLCAEAGKEKQMVSWLNRYGSICHFIKGYNPNDKDPTGEWINVDKKEKQMTRNEAIKIAREGGYTDNIIKLFEKLELIKFDEELDDLNRAMYNSWYNSTNSIDMIKFLDMYGYKIVKK